MKKLLLCLWFLACNAAAQANTSPDMNLPVPIPGVTPGPEWATDIVAALNQIDSHNHSFGQGVQIQPNGLDISSDLSFLSNNATALRSVIFTPQVAPIANTAPDVGSIYVSGNELYYNDATGGHQVKITTNGSVNAGAGSIGGLPSGTASVNYAGGTYTFQSATNTAANIDAASYIMRNSTASANGITLQPTLALASSYAITLPTLPAATSFLTMDTLGNINANVNTTGGITNAMLFGNINTSKLFPGDQVAIGTTSQSSDYTAVPSIGQILYNTASAHTLTLYSAVSNPGYRLIIQKITSDFNQLTITPFGSEKINGASGTSINTQWEAISIVSNGVGWVIENRTYPQIWASTTFGFSNVSGTNGITSVGTQASFSRRVGDSLECRLVFINMGVGANPGRLVLPSGLFIDTAKISDRQTMVGLYNRQTNNGIYYNQSAASGNAGVVNVDAALNTSVNISFQAQAVANPGYTTFTMNSFFSSGDGIVATFTVPILGWN